MKTYIITDHELNEIIQAAGDEVRGSFGKGDMEKAADKLEMLERRVEAREVPAYALGWYVIDENGDPKCERFSE